jgi:hypothetical protein
MIDRRSFMCLGAGAVAFPSLASLESVKSVFGETDKGDVYG